MRMAEQELAVQIREIDSVQINDVNVAIASTHEIFQQFAPDPTGSHDENARLA